MRPLRPLLVLVLILPIVAWAVPASAQSSGIRTSGRFTLPIGTYENSYNNESMSSPAYGNVVGNADPEIVIGNMDGRVFVTTMTGTVLGAYATGPGQIHSSPALADLNGDGLLDIVVGNTHGDVVAMTGSGQTIFRHRTNLENERLGVTGKPDDVYSTPAVGDIDNDGRPEVVVTSADHHLYAWNHDGSLVPGFPVWQKDTTWSSPALADIDNDGFAEIIVAFDIDYTTASHVGCPGFGASVRALDHTGTEKWHRCIPGEIITSSPAVADIDADGDLEIVIGSGLYFSTKSPGPEPKAPARKMWVLNAADGAVAPGWPVDLGAQHTASPAVGNLDGDAALEIATSAGDGRVSVYDADGSLKWRVCGLGPALPCPAPLEGSVGSSVSIADVDNDGANEVVSFLHDDLLVLKGTTGAVEERHPVNPGFVPRAQPTVVNHAGEATIILQGLKDLNANRQRDGADGLEVIVTKTGTALGAAPWPMSRQNPTRTGSFETSWAGTTWMDPWLSAIYKDLLGRTIDESGANYWKGRMGSGMSKAAVGQTFTYTDEWLGVVVDDLYLSILNRRPDAGGRAFWIGQLKAGQSTAVVVSSFFSSPEYFQAAGGTNGGFVDALYQAVLGRGSDATGRAYWVARLDAGAPRGDLSIQVFTSVESGGRRVDGLYATLLNRKPDAGGRAFWANYLTTNDELALTTFLIDSAEYQQRAEARFP